MTTQGAGRGGPRPGALQLRTLQTLAEVATEKNSTLIFPIPIEILANFVGRNNTGGRLKVDQPVGPSSSSLATCLASSPHAKW